MGGALVRGHCSIIRVRCSDGDCDSDDEEVAVSCGEE